MKHIILKIIVFNILFYKTYL